MIRRASSLMAASALHVAVLTGLGWWHGGGQDAGQTTARHVTPTHAGGWQWRLVSTQVPAPTQAPAQSDAVPDMAKRQPQEAAKHDAQLASSLPDAWPSGRAPVKDEYLPRGLLSQPPRALGIIDIPFPPGVPTPGRYKAVLALYIDELGVVRRIKTEGEALPAAYEEATRVSFQTASFQPGELHGHAVKSLIHVEVVFDDSQINRGMSSSALGQSVAQR
jgi:hypothetical protein